MSQCDVKDSQCDVEDSQCDGKDSKCDVRDFEKYIDETLMNVDDKEFLRKLGGFSLSLLQYVSKGRRFNTYDNLDELDVDRVNLFDLIDGGLTDWNSRINAVIVGRFILKQAKPIREQMRGVIKEDFPKFLGERANVWRYLMHLIHLFTSEGNPDFMTQFLITNACYVELTSYCYEIGQYSVIQHAKIVWITMMLHYFGDRLKKEQGHSSVLDFPLIVNKTGIDIVNKTGIDIVNKTGIDIVNKTGIDNVNKAGTDDVNKTGVDNVNNKSKKKKKTNVILEA